MIPSSDERARWRTEAEKFISVLATPPSFGLVFAQQVIKLLDATEWLEHCLTTLRGVGQQRHVNCHVPDGGPCICGAAEHNAAVDAASRGEVPE